MSEVFDHPRKLLAQRMIGPLSSSFDGVFSYKAERQVQTDGFSSFLPFLPFSSSSSQKPQTLSRIPLVLARVVWSFLFMHLSIRLKQWLVHLFIIGSCTHQLGTSIVLFKSLPVFKDAFFYNQLASDIS